MQTPMSPHHLTQWRSVSADIHVPTHHLTQWRSVSADTHIPHTFSRSGGQSVQILMSPHHHTQWRSVSADTHVPTSSHAVEVSQYRHPCPHVISHSGGQSVQTPISHTPSHAVEVSQYRHPCPHVISHSGGQSVQTPISHTPSHAVEVSQCRHPCPHVISRSGGQLVQTPMSPRHLTQWRSFSADTHVPTSSHSVEACQCRHPVKASQCRSPSSHAVEVSQCRHPCPHAVEVRLSFQTHAPVFSCHLTQWRSVSADTHVPMQWRYVCHFRHMHLCSLAISRSVGQSVQTPMSPCSGGTSVISDTCTCVPSPSHAVEVSQCRHPCPHAVEVRLSFQTHAPVFPRHLTQWRPVSAGTNAVQALMFTWPPAKHCHHQVHCHCQPILPPLSQQPDTWLPLPANAATSQTLSFLAPARHCYCCHKPITATSTSCYAATNHANSVASQN